MITIVVAALAFWPALSSAVDVAPLSPRANTKARLNYSNVSVSFDVSAGAKESMPLASSSEAFAVLATNSCNLSALAQDSKYP